MSLISPIHQHAAFKPNHTAVMLADKTISWSELDSFVWSTSKRFDEIGLLAGDLVVLCVYEPFIHLISSLALSRVGVSHITLPEKDLINNINLIEAKLKIKKIITDKKSFSNLSNKAHVIDQLNHVNISIHDKQSLSINNPTLPWMTFQSTGTTGGVKYAELTQQNVIDRNNRAKGFSLNSKDIFWAASGLNFISSKRRIFEALTTGATIILGKPGPITQSFTKLLREMGLTVGSGTPSHLHQLIKIGLDIPTIRIFEVSYATVSEELRQEFKTKINKNLYVIYGANEAGVISAANPEIQRKVKNTVGFPAESIKLEIVNKFDEILPSGTTGEIRVKGAGIISSYINNEIASASSFRDGWFYPGDIGYLTENGALILQGRKDDMMIFDGMNIYPAEIENILSSHSAVKEVAAFPLKHKQFQDIPVAAVTLKYAVSSETLINYCKQFLGIKYPKIIFILDNLPKNKMGKILKRDLVQLTTIKLLNSKIKP